MPSERFKAENIDEIVLLRLNRLKSIKLCEKLIRNKLDKNQNSTISEDIIKSKAIGLSSAIESAIGYWQINTQSINAKVLSRYYFLLQMTIAEQVSNIRNADDLKRIQRHTEHGHGLGTIHNPDEDFPSNYFTYIIKKGHFYAYLKSLGIDVQGFGFETRAKKFEELINGSKGVSLIDLFRRIPELRTVVEEYTDKAPLSFHVGYSDINDLNYFDEIKEHIDKTGTYPSSIPIRNNTQSYIGIYSLSERVTIDYLNSLELPLTEFNIQEDHFSKTKYIVGKLLHPPDKKWHQHISVYSSSYATSSLIVPLWGTTDTILINFTLLYTLSIIVRYLPDLWYRISSGDLNHIGSLIEYYISIIDHVIPLQMLERITEVPISIHQPGSIYGDI